MACMCASMCMCKCRCPWSLDKDVESFGVELQATMSHLIWALGTEAARKVYAPNPWVIAAVPPVHILRNMSVCVLAGNLGVILKPHQLLHFLPETI